MKIIHGIGASGGIVFGKTKKLREKDAVLESQTQLSYSTLEIIIEKTKEILMKLEQKAMNTIGKDEAEIFAMQQMLVDDESLLKQITTFQEEGLSLRDSIQKAVSAIALEFEQLDDEYMKERSTDFLNIGQLMVDILDGNMAEQSFQPDTILVLDELFPTDIFYLQEKEIIGVIAKKGGLNGHAAILTRSLQMPAILGIGESFHDIHDEENIIIDGIQGIVYLHPNKSTRLQIEKEKVTFEKQKSLIERYQEKAAVFNDGQPYSLQGNAGKLEDVGLLSTFHLEGIGLFRTEYIFHDQKVLPTEDEQMRFFRDVLERTGNYPVTFRTFDIGGDKPVAQLKVGDEANPFLGLRGIRLSFYFEPVFRTHLRALLRASVYGQMEIMFPFICSIDELIKAKKILTEVKDELLAEGYKIANKIPIGIMVEMPSAAIQINTLIKHCDFVSIGTNDLVQYTLGVDRTNPYVSSMYWEDDPAILTLIAAVAKSGKVHNIPVSLCGEMAGNSLFTMFLIGVGITKLSMSPARSSEIKEILSRVTVKECEQFAKQVLKHQSIKIATHSLR